MVGAIADWFAVTALFKHPLGLPIPHTALIPKRKDELGRGLEEFVGENFLQEDDHPRPDRGGRDLAARLGELARRDRPTPGASSTRSPRSPRSRSARCATSTSRAWSSDALVPRFREEPISPLLGGLLAEALRDDLHHGLVDLALEELHGWLVENPRHRAGRARRAGAVVGADSGSTSAVTARIHLELVRWVGDIRDDPEHRARIALDSVLTQLAAGPAARPRHPGARRARSRTGCSTTRR